MPDRIWDPVLVPSSEQWGLKNTSRTGGQSFTGAEQLVESPAARMAGSLTIPCNTQAKVLAVRRVIALGRSQVWIVGPYEYSRAPWSTDAYGRRITPKLLRRPDLDGTVYADGGAVAIADTLIPATVTNSVPMGATVIGISRPLGTVFRADVVSTTRGDLLPGAFFSIGNRLHTIVDIVDGSVATFRPWLRADAAAGTPVNLVSPKCRMRLASDPEGLALQLSRTGTITLDLVEAF